MPPATAHERVVLCSHVENACSMMRLTFAFELEDLRSFVSVLPRNTRNHEITKSGKPRKPRKPRKKQHESYSCFRGFRAFVVKTLFRGFRVLGVKIAGFHLVSYGIRFCRPGAPDTGPKYAIRRPAVIAPIQKKSDVMASTFAELASGSVSSAGSRNTRRLMRAMFTTASVTNAILM